MYRQARIFLRNNFLTCPCDLCHNLRGWKRHKRPIHAQDFRLSQPVAYLGFLVPRTRQSQWPTLREITNFAFSIPCIIIQLLQSEPTNVHSSIKFTIKSHVAEFPAARIHAENVKQLFCTILCPVMMGQSGPKHA